jgi:hypothetical protein
MGGKKIKVFSLRTLNNGRAQTRSDSEGRNCNDSNFLQVIRIPLPIRNQRMLFSSLSSHIHYFLAIQRVSISNKLKTILYTHIYEMHHRQESSVSEYLHFCDLMVIVHCYIYCVLDIVLRSPPLFYLETPFRLLLKTHNVSDTGFSSHFQVNLIHLGPFESASASLTGTVIGIGSNCIID